MAEKKEKEQNPRVVVAETLLRNARIIRRNGEPDEAIAAAEFEQWLEQVIENGGRLPKAA
jgi:hypothetical protein